MTKKQKTKICLLAKSLVGKPYKYGAKAEEAPNYFDCSSLTQYLYKQIGIELPRSSILQATDPKGKAVTLKKNFSNLEIGDLLFMRGVQGYYNDEAFKNKKIYIGHVAMYLGSGQVIHARNKLKGVTIQKLKDVVAKPNYKITFVKRF